MMHVLPSSKIPWNKVPLDMMISNKMTFLKKNEKRMKNKSAGGFQNKLHRPVQEREQEAAEAGLFLVDEF